MTITSSPPNGNVTHNPEMDITTDRSNSPSWTSCGLFTAGGDSAKGQPEPIAIIGMSCRLPGSASNLSNFWELLKSGRTAWTPGPGNRFNMKSFQHPSGGDDYETTNVRGAHFLKGDIRAFDAAFFGLNPLEVMAMDPQHRLLLEIAFEAFENAGLSLESLWESNTGVYVGQWTTDYHEAATRDVSHPPKYLVTGTGPAISSNRLSYFFNLHGPSFTVDTGCSSSLVALHQAIHSLRSGEALQCFVGGVNLLLDPQRFVYQSKLSMFSDEGRCFSFDSRASGYGRGEGCTGVVLKPLSTALADGDNIRAVIPNSAVTQDGRTPGLTVPSAEAQTEAIFRAYRLVSGTPQADYVEAHGTGTKVGDPIEAGAIAEAFKQDGHSGEKLPIGSVKANIGHTEAAAGLAGLIKAVLMLEHGAIPPQANFITPNPGIDLDELNLRIPTKLEQRDLRRISVNSFGYGGTNAHVIVEKATDVPSPSTPRSLSTEGNLSPLPDEECKRVFFISAASEKSCQILCGRLSRYLPAKCDLAEQNRLLARLAYTLGKLSVHAYRLGVVASNVNDLSSQLRAAEHSPIAKSEWQGKPSIGFVFSGQGAQYAQMGRQLLTYPTFLRSMEKARQKLIHLGCTWDLLVELCRCDGESRINEPAISQPSCTAIQLALVDLLVEFGVFPCAVVGHSSGEIAAAYAIGVISFDNAMAASYFRGKVTSDLLADDSHSPGAMLAVGASPDAVVEHIQKIESEHSRMRVACFNSPRSVTVSGDATAIDALKVGLDANGTFNRKLKTNGAAYHSHHMEAVREEYAASLRGLGHTQRSKEPHGRFFSTVSGKEIDPSEICADYWTRNLLSPVLFTQAFSKMGEGKYGDRHLDAVLEIGPHSQLAGPVKQILNESPKTRGRPRYISSLTRGKDAELSLLECLAQLHIHGASLPLHQLNRYDPRHPPKRLVDLPPYPFDYARTFWHDSRVSKNYTHRKYLPHELLGTLSPEANRLEPQWRHFLSIKKSPWLRSHVVQGQIVFPAAGYLTMAMQAVHQHMKTTSPSTRIGSFALRNISISKALLLSEGTPELEVCLSLRPQPRSARESSTWNEFRIFSATPDDKWTEHCRGLIQSVAEAEEVDGAGLICGLLKQGSAQCSRPVKPERFYHLSRQIGLHWQHPFNNISGLRTGVGACVTTASSPDGAAPGGVGDVLHPALLDSCLFQGHCASLMLERDLESPAVPTFIRDMRVSNKPVPPGKTLHATSVGSPQDQYTYDVAVQNESNTNQPLLVVAHGVTLAKLPGGSAGQQNEDICYSVNWTPYVDAWKAEDRNKFCNRMPSPEPNLQRSRFLLSLSAHYTRQAVAQVQQGEVLDAYRELFSKLQTSAESSDNNSPMPEATPGLDAEVFSEALLKVGPHLPSILTGKVNALSLMTADDFVRVYDSNHSRQCISQISEYCYALGKQTPRLSVLATGAGTAPATAPVVRALNGRDGRYLSKLEVTDMSDGQFELIKEDLGSLADVVELRALDAACDVTQQGFDIATYDLIVATYPVHTVRQLDLVLSNLRQMLKPGGKLVILVVTKGTPHYEFLFDIFEGQSATTGEVATGTHRLSPVLERPAWISKMKDAGLQNPEFCFEDCPEINGGTLSVFMGTGPWDVGPAAQLPLHLVTTDCSLVEMSAVEARIGQIRDCLPDAHISVQGLSTTSTGDNMVILLPEVARYMCGNRDESCWQRFKNLLLNARAVLLVSSSSSSNGPDRHNEPCGAIWLGLARCLRLEHPHIRFVAIDFSSGDIFHKLAAQLPVLLHRTPTFCLNRPGNETENEFKEMEGQLYISRINAHRENSDYIHSMHRQSLPTLTPFFGGNRLLTAELGTSGLLETFRWKDDDKAPVLGADDVRLELRAASINFKDVLVAAGQLPGITEMRNDCSGVVVEVGANMQQRFKPGDRVMALYSRPYTNYPVVHGDCCHVMPNNLSFEEGASVPIVWGTVYHSLVDMGRLTKGNKLLIHSAAGAVGQAAIMLAQHVGAEVFATVSSQCKRDLLHDQFSIPYDHIFSSRTTAFAAGIRELTGGYGVDVVLNSLSGEMFRHSCNLVAPFGRFVEIGRKELMDDALMPMAFLLKNISFVYVDMSLIIDVKKPLARRILNDVGHFLATGSIRPVSITTMPISEIEAAFRHIQAGKHTGKIVLKVEDNQEVKALPPMPAPAKFKTDATYLVVGGFGGIGRAVIEWLAENGAKQILCVSRSGIKDHETQEFVSRIEQKGVKLTVAKCDVTSEEEVASMARRLRENGLHPVRGVIQSSVVFEDCLFEEMTAETWHNVLGPKVRGTSNLHNSFQTGVDFFVVMSSIISICGNDGQANYAAALCFQDELVRQRAASGLHAFSMNIGPVSDAGYLSERPDLASEVQRRGFGSVTISQVLSMLNRAITHQPQRDNPSSSVCAISPRPYIEHTGEQVKARDLRFTHLMRRDTESRKGRDADAEDELEKLERACTFEDAVDLVCAAFLRQLGKLIATPPEMLNPEHSLDHYGVDSLIAVEMRNWIVAYLRADLPLMTIRSTGSIRELAKLITQESPLVGSY